MLNIVPFGPRGPNLVDKILDLTKILDWEQGSFSTIIEHDKQFVLGACDLINLFSNGEFPIAERPNSPFSERYRGREHASEATRNAFLFAFGPKYDEVDAKRQIELVLRDREVTECMFQLRQIFAKEITARRSSLKNVNPHQLDCLLKSFLHQYVESPNLSTVYLRKRVEKFFRCWRGEAKDLHFRSHDMLP